MTYNFIYYTLFKSHACYIHLTILTLQALVDLTFALQQYSRSISPLVHLFVLCVPYFLCIHACHWFIYSILLTHYIQKCSWELKIFWDQMISWSNSVFIPGASTYTSTCGTLLGEIIIRQEWNPGPCNIISLTLHAVNIYNIRSFMIMAKPLQCMLISSSHSKKIKEYESPRMTHFFTSSKTRNFLNQPQPMQEACQLRLVYRGTIQEHLKLYSILAYDMFMNYDHAELIPHIGW